MQAGPRSKEALSAEAAAVLAEYELAPILDVTPLEGGMFLRPLLIETARGRYVLRAHAFRADAARLRFQAEAVNHVADGGFLCPRVIRDRRGRWAAARRRLLGLARVSGRILYLLDGVERSQDRAGVPARHRGAYRRAARPAARGGSWRQPCPFAAPAADPVPPSGAYPGAVARRDGAVGGERGRGGRA